MKYDPINMVFKEQDEITSDIIDNLYDGSFRILHAYVFSMCMDGTLTDEVVYRVLVKATSEMKRFNHMESVFKWLCRMAHDELHSEKYEKRFVPPEENPNLKNYIRIGKPTDNEAVLAEDATKLSYALKKTNSVYRDIFYLKTLGRLPDKIIAEFYERPVSFVQVTYLRAKDQIIRFMEEV